MHSNSLTLTPSSSPYRRSALIPTSSSGHFRGAQLQFVPLACRPTAGHVCKSLLKEHRPSTAIPRRGTIPRTNPTLRPPRPNSDKMQCT